MAEWTTVLEDFCARVARRFRGRYVVMLEDEVVRLRAENRALVNSLLGTAGFPPLDQQFERGPFAPVARRRSWPQIAAARAAEEVRRGERMRTTGNAPGER